VLLSNDVIELFFGEELLNVALQAGQISLSALSSYAPAAVRGGDYLVTPAPRTAHGAEVKTRPLRVRWVVDLAALGPITAHKCAEYVNSELQWAVAMAIATLRYEPTVQLILTR